MRIGLVGNPNSGKTTLFNKLTGARQRVGNWSGVTVEKKTGQFAFKGQTVEVVDLPGTYSLSVTAQTGSVDEQIACAFILSQQADVIVNIIDAANLERNLYLTCQLLEMGVPVVLALNMVDIAKQRGIKIDVAQLEALTGCPVVSLVSRRGQGVETLKQRLLDTVPVSQPLQYGPVVEKAIAELMPLCADCIVTDQTTHNARWLALRLLENDGYAAQFIHEQPQLQKTVLEQQQRIETEAGEEADLLLADARYQMIGQWLQQCLSEVKTTKQFVTEWVDKITLNRWLGIPVFLLVMYLMFEFSITIGGALQPIFDDGSRTLFIDGISYLGVHLGLPLWLTAVLAQGVGLGVNTVVTFVPQIGGLFLFLSLIEDSGYMARAAFVMDRLMQWVGLPGKSFVPLIVGFGCNVPAIMAARTLDSRRDRLLTIMMAPFMSCGARLAIFAVFSTAFFPKGGALVVFLLYITGIAVAILTGLVVKKTLLKGQPAPFVMELPPYHLPNVKSILMTTWQRLKKFLFRAGKVIVPVCVLVGSLNAITLNGEVHPNGSHHSILSEVGKAVTPVLAPMGVSQQNWPATVGLITGTLAKEVVVGTLNTLYSQNQSNVIAAGQHFDLWRGLKQAVMNTYHSLVGLGSSSFVNPFVANEADHHMTQTAMGQMTVKFGGMLSAFAYMLFVLLYVPCVSAIGVTVREAGKGWAWLSVIWSTSIAYGLAVIVYQLFSITAHPISSIAWSVGMLAYLGLLIFAMHLWARKRRFEPMVQNRPCGGCSAKGGCHG